MAEPLTRRVTRCPENVLGSKFPIEEGPDNDERSLLLWLLVFVRWRSGRVSEVRRVRGRPDRASGRRPISTSAPRAAEIC
jgi:hypothetical protein